MDDVKGKPGRGMYYCHPYYISQNSIFWPYLTACEAGKCRRACVYFMSAVSDIDCEIQLGERLLQTMF